MITREMLKPFRHTERQDFFTVPGVMTLIDDLAKEPRLTLFLGAGASVAQGLPNWNDLLTRLLMQVSHHDRRFANDVERGTWAGLILQSFDSTAAGSVIKARARDGAFASHLHTALYATADDLHVRQRGSDRFARAVWNLILFRKEAGLETSVVTLNYDDELEALFKKSASIRAHADRVGISGVVSIHDEATYKEYPNSGSLFPVIHLHGFMPREDWEKRRSQAFVLSSLDFSEPWETHWSQEVLDDRALDKWLMVGMSFQDSHVNSLLRRRRTLAAGGPLSPAIGIMSTQGRPWHNQPATVVDLLAESEQTRLAELDLILLLTSYFFQDYTFLDEVAHKSKDANLPSYTDRRRKWHDSVSLGTEKKSPLLDRRQSQVREKLISLRDSLEALLPPAASDEQIKVELWLRDIEKRSLRMVASSEIRIVDHSRAQHFALSRDSPMAAVRGFTHGAVRTHERDAHEQGAWRSFTSFPVRLESEPYWDLPIGAIVVASTLPLVESIFVSDGMDASRRVYASMPEITAMLGPSSPFGKIMERMI
ncbi:SIR2 family protein [Nostocoides australiense]